MAMSNPLPAQLLDIESVQLHCIPMIASKVTKRGQTTLPRQIRNSLHLEAGQTLIYEIREDEVVIKAHPGALASFAALAPITASNIDFKKAHKKAREDWRQHASHEGDAKCRYLRSLCTK